jgi:hypothetical protein
MANFAAFIMEPAGPAGITEPADFAEPAGVTEFPDPAGIRGMDGALLPEKTALADIRLETGGVWNLPDSRFILQP